MVLWKGNCPFVKSFVHKNGYPAITTFKHVFRETVRCVTLTFAQTGNYSFVMVIIPTREGDREERLILSVSRAVFQNGKPKYGSDYFHSDTIQQY